ncbi:MAG: transcriptional repressor [Thermonemataceae bacterium]|nr:transcriptional repressor [Thermonemataceae bacterium]
MKTILSYQAIKEKLTQYDLKATSQRLVIYEAIYNCDKHPTAEYIFEKIHPKNPSISLATVYKTLDTFAEVGLIKRVNSNDGSLRFDAHTDLHNHLYCVDTKEIIDFEDNSLSQLLQDFLASKQFDNFLIKDFQLQIIGEKLDKTKKIAIYDKEKK